MQVIARDITKRKRVEAELALHRERLEALVDERTAQLAAARDRAEAADRAKSAFLATMSHELRTPLNTIIGFTGVLLGGQPGGLNGEQRKQLTMVRDASRHLLALINDVLDISRIEAGQLEVAAERLDVDAVATRAADVVAPLARDRGLALEIVPGGAVAVGDLRRVEQVLLNLLGNAVKFTEVGRVEVRTRAAGGLVEVEVSDTGPGISPADLPRLFSPFSRLEASRGREGTGLGLSICRRLVEAMGGQIHVESEPGEGSTFCFTLPAAKGDIP